MRARQQFTSGPALELAGLNAGLMTTGRMQMLAELCRREKGLVIRPGSEAGVVAGALLELGLVSLGGRTWDGLRVYATMAGELAYAVAASQLSDGTWRAADLVPHDAVPISVYAYWRRPGRNLPTSGDWLRPLDIKERLWQNSRQRESCPARR